MTASERETAGEKSVRSAHVAYFLPPDWGRIARIVAPTLERITPGAAATAVLVLVPDGGAALALARALAALQTGARCRTVAVTTSSRGKRLLADGRADVVVGSPAALAPLLGASALKLDQVAGLIFAAADELDADDADLAALVAEVPRTATRTLTATTATPGVEQLLERHMHRARRVTEDLVAAPGTASPTQLRFVAVGGSPLDALPGVLDEVDAPSATIVTGDAATATAARALLAAIGYGEGALATVSDGTVAPNTALVVFLGVPTGSQWGAAVAATPANLVAIVATRDLSALQLLAAPAPVRPFVARGTISKARAAEARARAELRDVLSEGVPAREILALEPLLVEHDGLEVAAAALRLLDRTRASQADLVREAEKRVRTEMAAAATPEAPPRSGPPPRSGAPRDAFPFRSSGPPRGDRAHGDRPRSGGPRSEGPRGPRRDDDRPRGPRRDDDRPPRGPRRDDDRGPRGPRRDDDRPRGPRGPR